MEAAATGSSTPDRDELAAFELALDERVCDEVRPAPWGRLFLTPSLPLIWDANWVSIEREGLAPAEVVAIADEALGGAGYAHRTVGIAGEADGRRLAEELEAEPGRWPGWEVERDRFMLWRADSVADPPDPPPAPPARSQKRLPGDQKCELAGARRARLGAREVRLAEIEGLRRAITIEEGLPIGMPQPQETAEQLFELDRRYGLVAGDRWFAAPAEGEPLSCCRLLRTGGIAQVEDVATRAHARGRGYAKAVVRAAIAAARAAGDETIFLLADAADWPQLLYGRLGFETVGERTILRRRP